jgi:hypothetical protein
VVLEQRTDIIEFVTDVSTGTGNVLEPLARLLLALIQPSVHPCVVDTAARESAAVSWREKPTRGTFVLRCEGGLR